MSTPPAPRKRTQFASFLTDAATDLSGFKPSIAEDIGTEAELTQPETSTQRLEAQDSAQAGKLAPPSAVKTEERGLTAEMPANPQTSQVLDRSTEEANAHAAGVMRTAAQTPNTDIVKISVKVDAVTFLELKRALRLRETLQEFCLNAITRELGARTGKA